MEEQQWVYEPLPLLLVELHFFLFININCVTQLFDCEKVRRIKQGQQQENKVADVGALVNWNKVYGSLGKVMWLVNTVFWWQTIQMDMMRISHMRLPSASSNGKHFTSNILQLGWRILHFTRNSFIFFFLSMLTTSFPKDSVYNLNLKFTSIILPIILSSALTSSSLQEYLCT